MPAPLFSTSFILDAGTAAFSWLLQHPAHSRCPGKVTMTRGPMRARSACWKPQQPRRLCQMLRVPPGFSEAPCSAKMVAVFKWDVGVVVGVGRPAFALNLLPLGLKGVQRRHPKMEQGPDLCACVSGGRIQPPSCSPNPVAHVSPPKAPSRFFQTI